MKNPLNDKQFLKQLDQHNNKTIYARITALDQNEFPKESIEGKVTGGSINIEGKSALNRTCSLSLLAWENPLSHATPITDAYWAFENKFKLEIGVQNTINSEYPDIIWFKQGIFIITSFSKSKSTTAYNISISGRDKMCLLNGTIGGQAKATISFDVLETIDDNGDSTITKIPIKTIIQEGVLTYGNERLHNIVINDLDDNGWELWEYRGDKPMYMFYQNEKVINFTLDGDTLVKLTDNSNKKISELDQYYSFNTLDNDYNNSATKIKYNNIDAYVIKCEYGDTVGYHPTELIYNTDLVLNPGEPFTNVLDKIVTMLGEYEYFYNVDGRFVFQKKKTYLQDLFSPFNGDILEPTMITTPYSYKFDDPSLFTALAESPKVDNIKNDFVVWGSRAGTGSSSLPFHVRYAIDKKPVSYISPYRHYQKETDLYFLACTKLDFEKDIKEKVDAIVVDEGITSNDVNKAKKFFKENEIYYVSESDHANSNNIFKTYQRVTQTIYSADLATYTNDDTETKPRTYFTIDTYESYETLKNTLDDEVHNRHKILYKKEIDSTTVIFEQNDANKTTIYKYVYCKSELTERKYYTFDSSKNKYVEISWKPVVLKGKNIGEAAYNGSSLIKYSTKIYNLLNSSDNLTFDTSNWDWRELIYQMADDFYKHKEEIDFYKKIEEANPQFINGKTGYEQYYEDIQGFWRQLYNPYPSLKEQDNYYPENNTDKYWNKLIHSNPAALAFWFDILDVGDDWGLGKYSISKIGVRSKVENNNEIKSIYYEETPETQFIIIGEDAIEQDTSYTPIFIEPSMEQLFAISSQGQSGIGHINKLMNQHTVFNEGLNITSIPIFYLEPNTRIYIEGYGDYVINNISYSLNYNGTMSLNCTKIVHSFI